MFDTSKTLSIIKGGLIEPVKTWETYLQENHAWRETTTLLTAPLVVVSAIVVSLLSWIFSSHYMFSARPGFYGFLLGILAAFAGLFLAAFIFSYFAGLFNGKNDFNRGFAAVSLAAIPSYAGSILGTLPSIGMLLSLAMSIVGLVFLYKLIPSYLEVPQQKRTLHFVVSLLATVVAAAAVGMALGVVGYSNPGQMPQSGSQGSGYSMFGGLGRQAEMMEQAGNDRYEPPADGKISDAQMTRYLATLGKVQDLRDDQQKKIEQFQQESKGKKDFSLSDMGSLTSGMGSVLGSMNAEMEVVKTGGGNWAEYSWIKEQLHIARIQKDINAAVKHNYALYQAHEKELDAAMQ